MKIWEEQSLEVNFQILKLAPAGGGHRGCNHAQFCDRKRNVSAGKGAD